MITIIGEKGEEDGDDHHHQNFNQF